MIVDDDESIREVVDVFLTGEGYEIVTAPNGAIALERLKESQPDVILLDAMMPVMDGREFAEAYWALPGRHASVVLLTAAADTPESLTGIKVDAYVAKPFDLDGLLAIVQQQQQVTRES
ncbi:MAG: hypothetical protein QOF51_3277 [Chloroflexota bacterium]|jgi:two-component system response regulator MtrA|nr:hypothetical protein [Chloroflexota bacterium]